jgi:iron complex transport system substrate-binding protein
LLGVLAVSLLLAGLVGCGSSSPTKSASPSTSSPASGPTAHRIVSLSSTATEMLFALGADHRVVAVDSQSDYPARAPKTKLSAYEPNVEAIAKYHPDLVVFATDTKGLKAGLQKLEIRVLQLPAAVTVDDTYHQIAELGDVTGRPKAAAALVTRIKSGLAKAVARLEPRTKPLTYYYELDNTLYTVTSKTFVGSLFTMAKLDNVADPADADGKSGGYPQLSAEFLVKANPDLVFLADSKCCGQDEKTFGARPGFDTMKAVTDHQVITLDDDIASRWGPRIVDLLDRIVDAANTAPAA